MAETSSLRYELSLHLHAETDLAIRVSDDCDVKKSVWLAKSQITIERVVEDTIWIWISEWLGVQKGLL